MNVKLPLIAAMFAIASLSACGGGSDGAPSAPVYSPAALVKTDTTVGTGAEAALGKTVSVHYTGYLYTTTTTDFKGVKIDTSIGKPAYSLVLGTTPVVEGFKQGIVGMKVGGKRTVIIPASMGYGSDGKGTVPPNSGLVFDLELLEVK